MDRNLSIIKKNKKKLQKIIKNPNYKKELYKWLKTELAYTSNSIEGNTLTRKETKYAIEEGVTTSSKPLRHYLEAINHAKAFDKIINLVDTNASIDENLLLDIHKIILMGLDDDNAGFYRNCRVSISGSDVIMPNPIKVPELMADFFIRLKKNVDDEPLYAILSHLELVSIHPFVDGNGRCARLLMNTLLLKYGYTPIIIRPADRKKYISAIEMYQLKGDIKPYKKLMLKLLDRSMKFVITMFDEKVDVEKDKLITISKYAKLLNVPISTIRYWVKIGKIAPVAYTNSGYMLFKNEKFTISSSS